MCSNFIMIYYICCCTTRQHTIHTSNNSSCTTAILGSITRLLVHISFLSKEKDQYLYISMGSGLSIDHLSKLKCDVMGEAILQCASDDAYLKFCEYKRIFIDQKITGAHLSCHRNEETLRAYLCSLGIENYEHQSTISARLHSTYSIFCDHPFLDFRDGVYYCTHCKDAIFERGHPERVKHEKEMEQRVAEADRLAVSRTNYQLGAITPQEVNSYLSLQRGVKISFLVDFTRRNDLWKVPTWKVRRDFILPATCKSRCQYTELEEMQEFVGHADTYVCHTWGACFGDMVAAVADGAAADRCVWVDIFAVRQWPGHSVDLDFSSVIHSCASFMFVCSSPLQFSNISDSELGLIKSFYRENRDIFALSRLWCLVELAAAIQKPDVAVIIKGGSANISQDNVRFDIDKSVFVKLLPFVDVQDADAGCASDEHSLLTDVRAAPGGADTFNSLIKAAIKGSLNLNSFPSRINQLHCAACGDKQAIEALLVEQDSVHLAAAGGYLVLLKVLLSKGLNASLKGANGATAGIIAAAGGHTRCLELLLQHGVDINEIDDDGRSALMHAAAAGYDDCLVALLKAGADYFVEDNDGISASMIAAMCGQRSSLEILLDFGVNPDQITDDGDNILMMSAKCGHASCVQYLVNHVSDINAVNNSGNSALMFAASAGSDECIKVLLQESCCVTVRDNDGHTALMAAAAAGSLACIKLLIAAGCPVDDEDDEGCSAYMFATANAFDDCSNFLVSVSASSS